MVSGIDSAYELSQEVFLKVFTGLDRYDRQYKSSPWLYKIASNHTIDYLRKRKLDTVSIDGSPHARTSEEEAQTRLVVESH